MILNVQWTMTRGTRTNGQTDRANGQTDRQKDGQTVTNGQIVR